MIAYAYNENGYFNGTVNCQKDPVRSKHEGRDIYLLPANATFLAPSDFDSAKEIAVWNGKSWCIEQLPELEPIPDPEPTQLDIIKAQVTYTAMMTDTLLGG